MKLFLGLIFLVITSAHASIENLNYNILPGQLHTGGTLDASVLNINVEKNTMEVLLNYDVKKKPLVPASPDLLKNSMTIELPLEFHDERGYLDLEQQGTMDLEKVTITHMGRTKLNMLDNVHLIRIVGKNKKFDIDLFYHPSVPEMGWPQLKLTLHVVLLNNYVLAAELKQ